MQFRNIPFRFVVFFFLFSQCCTPSPSSQNAQRQNPFFTLKDALKYRNEKKIDFFNLEKASDKLISYDKNPFFFFFFTKI